MKLNCIIPVLVLILIFIIFFLVSIYLTKRFNFYFNFKTQKKTHVIFILLIFLPFLGIFLTTNSITFFSNAIYITSSLTISLVLSFLLAIVFTDLLKLFLKLKLSVYRIISISLSIVIFACGTWNAFNPQVSYIEIPIRKIGRELRLMQITDVHLGHFHGKDYLQTLVQKTNDSNVELVCITGDLFDGKIQLKEEVLLPLKQLNAPVYFVEGNHDEYSNADVVKSLLRKVGVRVLENEIEVFNDIQIIGLDYVVADNEEVNMHANNDTNTIKSIMQRIKFNTALPTILLHHSPVGCEYVAEKDIDLYLAGHTHGGQTFPASLITSIILKHNKGLYDLDRLKIFISEGAGTWGPPMRFLTKNEINLIKLIPMR
jgi:predicted MPP superfamily phosphohydrolase